MTETIKFIERMEKHKVQVFRFSEEEIKEILIQQLHNTADVLSGRHSKLDTATMCVSANEDDLVSVEIEFIVD